MSAAATNQNSRLLARLFHIGEVGGEKLGRLLIAAVDFGGDRRFGPGVEEKRPYTGQFAAGVEECGEAPSGSFRSWRLFCCAADDPFERGVVEPAVQRDQQRGAVGKMNVEGALGMSGCSGDIGDRQSS